MWALIRRGLPVNRAHLAGAVLTLTAAIGMLTTAGAWMTAGLTDPALTDTRTQLATVTGSFIGIAALIAGMTVSSTIATGLRERRRQVALLAAVGATRTRLRTLILLETVLLFVIAAPVGAALGYLLGWLSTPLMVSAGLAPTGYLLPVDAAAAVTSSAVMVAVAVVAAVAASRKNLQAPAATAVRTAAVESPVLSTSRRIGAGVAAAAGVGAAVTPFVLPGMIGVAFATISTFLLITALALIGPALAGILARVLARVVPESWGLGLAIANVRGFSRRLTVVVVPFALVAALATVQLSTNAIVAAAARDQLAAGISADLVGTATSPYIVEKLTAEAGVSQVAVLGSTNADILADPDEDMPVEIWEPATLTTLTPGGHNLIDPAVTAGSLDDLTGNNSSRVR